jgi:phosphate transport system protein
MSDHVIKQYEEELSRLRQMTLAMGELTGDQLDSSIAVAEHPDRDLAGRIIEREPEADRLEHQIDNLVIRLLALRQPVAIDLREILSSLRIANELERICDYAESLAKRLIAIEETGVEPMRSLVALGRFATAMVKDAMHAYLLEDAREAQEVWDRDRELDAMYTSLFRELITYMIEEPRRITATTHMLFMARDLERVGDRATNIAESVLYLFRSVPVEEERPKADATKTILIPSVQRAES